MKLAAHVQAAGFFRCLPITIFSLPSLHLFSEHDLSLTSFCFTIWILNFMVVYSLFCIIRNLFYLGYWPPENQYGHFDFWVVQYSHFCSKFCITFSIYLPFWQLNYIFIFYFCYFMILKLDTYYFTWFCICYLREKAHRPFRCLDCQYRRELVRVYLSNVEQICRRFVEERRNKICKLIEDGSRWSR